MRPLLVDVSKWQGDIDFKKMRSEGVVGVFIKATQWQVDPRFRGNWVAAKEAGLPRGAYHFANKSQWKSARQQAQFLWNAVKDDPPEIGLVLDFETRDGIGLSWIKAFLEEATKLSGKKCIFSCNISVWNELRDSENATWILDYPLWISYPYTNLLSPVVGIPDDLGENPYQPNGNLALPNIWVKKNVPWKFWQYTYVGDGWNYGAESKGLDLNVYNGTQEEFDAEYGGGGGTQPEPPSGDKYIRTLPDMPATFLRFRTTPILYTGDTPAVGRNVVMKLVEPEKIRMNGIDWWHVELDGRTGFISAEDRWTERYKHS